MISPHRKHVQKEPTVKRLLDHLKGQLRALLDIFAKRAASHLLPQHLVTMLSEQARSFKQNAIKEHSLQYLGLLYAYSVLLGTLAQQTIHPSQSSALKVPTEQEIPCTTSSHL